MDEVLKNPFFIAAALMIVFIVLPVLLFVYLPRAAEIASLQRQLAEKNDTIERMSKNQTRAELEHHADKTWLRQEILDARKEQGSAQARAVQQQSIADQIARAHGRLAGKGETA